MENVINNNTKSKRMRDLIKRSSTRQLYISKSLIKQNADSAIINIFVFDRLKKKYNKKLFYLKNDLNNILFKNEVRRERKTKLIQLRKNASRFNVNYNNYPKLLNASFFNKKQNLKNLFLFYFLKWSLSAFSIKVCLLKKGDLIINNDIINITNNCIIIYSKTKENTFLNTVERGIEKGVSSVKQLTLDSREYYKVISINQKVFNIKTMTLLNNLLFKYLYLLMSTLTPSINSNGSSIKIKILLLFKYFKNTYYKIFIKKYLRKEYLTLNYLYKLYINRAKLSNLLPGLKYILNQIYNKKIELNIVNLKYLHLNSDIFTNAISIKLKKKTSKLLRILKKSLKLVKIPEMRRENNVNINTLYVRTSYQGLSLNNLYRIKNKYIKLTNGEGSFKDRINKVISKMFSNKINGLLLHNNILTSIKYKWITGVRLEAKGRLTKRFTASRSLFKFKYKGNLKNLDYLSRSMNIKSGSYVGTSLNKTNSLHMIRNADKPNIQYTNLNSKKRIGTFGIKGWISNN